MPVQSSERSFLPDFCGIRPVFVTVVSTELLAFVVTLVGGAGWPMQLDRLALNSLFLQWIALGCAGVLCLAGRWLAGASDALAATVASLTVLTVTWLVSELAWVVLGWTGPGRAADIDRGEFLARNLAVAAVLGACALRYLYLQHHWQRRVRSESEARIEALQARIRPHFFFNCMNTIASLTRSNPAAAEEAIEDLADLFRASLADGRARVSLREELALCRRYLHIESLRLGERLKVDWRIEALPQEAMLPGLTLQPLLENAIHHGIEPLPGGGLVRVRGERAPGLLRIVVENPLPGPGAQPHAGHGLAHENLRQRLAAHFGERARLRAGARDGVYEVELTLPWTEAADAHPGG